MNTIYNEIDPYAVRWLSHLVGAEHIAPGEIDGRDIREVRPKEIQQATQFHAFAGIGVWSYGGYRPSGTIARLWERHRPASRGHVYPIFCGNVMGIETK